MSMSCIDLGRMEMGVGVKVRREREDESEIPSDAL